MFILYVMPLLSAALALAGGYWAVESTTRSERIAWICVMLLSFKDFAQSIKVLL